MKKTKIFLPVCALTLSLLTCAGCLKFENSMDLSVPLKEAGATGTYQGAQPNGYNATQVDPNAASSVYPTDNAGMPVSAASPGSAEQQNGTGTTAPSGNGAQSAASTTAAPNDTAAAESTTASGDRTQSDSTAQDVASYVASLGTTEYDILRSNDFTIVATMETGGEKQDMNMSVGNDQIYFTADMDGMEIGLYVTGQKTYIYYPPEKKYLKLSAAVAKIMGLETDELANTAKSMGFETMPELSKALSMKDGSMDGTPCKVFFFKNVEDGNDMQIYMDGKKILAIEDLDSSGNRVSIMKFTSVTAGFPQMPPSGYEEIGYMKFLEILYNAMGN